MSDEAAGTRHDDGGGGHDDGGRAGGLRVVVTGATGNAGTSVVRALAAAPRVGTVLGLARRTPGLDLPGVEWAAADVAPGGDDLAPLFAGADAVVHLAWRFRPTRDPVTTWRTNVLGSLRVFRAAAASGAGALVHASSVGAYSPGPKDRPVDESWPTDGWPQAAYCREKAYLERVLDTFERDHPGIRVVRMRPAFLFKREAAPEQLRIFGNRLVPPGLVRREWLPAVPDLPGLTFQALHTDDAAAAYRETVLRPVRGAFNLAADPPLDSAVLAGLLGARVVRLPAAPVRAVLAAAWRARLVGASPGLFDAVLRLPLMDAGRARDELDWRPRHTARAAMEEFLAGLREPVGEDTAPLAA